MICRYFSFFHSYLFLILVFHDSLEGQNQFGRIFKENAKTLFKEEIKQDTIVKQKIVFEELLDPFDIVELLEELLSVELIETFFILLILLRVFISSSMSL